MKASLVGEGQNYDIILTSGDLEKVASEPISCPLERSWESLDKVVRLSFGESAAVSLLPAGVSNWASTRTIDISVPNVAYQYLRDGVSYEFSQGAFNVSVRR